MTVPGALASGPTLTRKTDTVNALPTLPVDPSIPCQRWNRRRDSYRPAGEVIDTARYGVELLAEADAKAFVKRHHYSGSYPAARLRVGLYRSRGPFQRAELVGAAVYSVPMSQRVIPKWTGLAPSEGVELGRLVLLDDVEGNGETWFLARAMALVRSELPAVRAVLSCSDPVKRTGADGRIILPGHVGTIYQALNARHVGRTGRATLNVTPTGQVVSKRALSKIAGGESGAAYASRQLLELGAPAQLPGESGQAWIARVKASGWLGRFRHPGNLVYLWAVGGKGQRRRIASRFPEPLAYPKARDTVIPMAVRSAA